MTFPFVSTYIALWALVLFQTLVIVGLVRQLAEIRELAEGGRLPKRLPEGAHAPRLRGVDLRTGATVDSSLLQGRELTVLFLSPSCKTCWRLADGTRHLQDLSMPLVTVCTGDETKCRELVDRLTPGLPALLDGSGGLVAAYGVSSTPAAFVLDPEGRVLASGDPKHAGEMEELVTRARKVTLPAEEMRDTAGG